MNAEEDGCGRDGGEHAATVARPLANQGHLHRTLSLGGGEVGRLSVRRDMLPRFENLSLE